MTIARFTPLALFRRWLAVREAEVAREIAVAAIYQQGRTDERRILAGTP